MKVTKVVTLADHQYDQQDDRAIAVTLKVIKIYRPHTVVFKGDFVSFDSVGSYAKSSWREASLTLKSEIDSANRGLDLHDKVFKQSGVKRKIYLGGNHEDRLIKWMVNNAANLGDMLRIEELLHLGERGYEYYPTYKQPIQLGKLDVMHGHYTNQHHAAKTINLTHRNSLYCHSHDHQVSISSHYPEDLPRIAMSGGCLCKFNQPYIGNRPTRWVHGCTIVEYLPDGFFTAHFIPIIGYRCVFRGKEIKG